MNSRPLQKLSRRELLRTAGLATAGLVWGGGALRGQNASAVTANGARYPELKYTNLAGNENPYGPSQAVSLAIMREIKNSCRYPFREEVILIDRIAEIEGVSPAHVVLGNGCDEILSLAGDTYGQLGGNVVATRPTYLELMRYAEKRGAVTKWVDHTATMHHDLEAMARAVDADTGIVYVCNPDTPSGTFLERGQITDFCREVTKTTPVFVDEVYLELMDDFREQTLVDLVREGLPVIVGRSFSKMHGLAGHRIGYAIAPPDIAEELRQRKMSSLNYLGVIAATASLQDHRFHAQSRKLIAEGRTRFTALLDELSLAYTPSAGNFIFHYTGMPIGEFQAKMKMRNFLVGRPFPPYDDWCRISIGQRHEMDAYEQAMRAIFRG
jgi:histidinol-phosphate aminotransferase